MPKDRPSDYEVKSRSRSNARGKAAKTRAKRTPKARRGKEIQFGGGDKDMR